MRSPASRLMCEAWSKPHEYASRYCRSCCYRVTMPKSVASFIILALPVACSSCRPHLRKAAGMSKPSSSHQFMYLSVRSLSPA